MKLTLVLMAGFLFAMAGHACAQPTPEPSLLDVKSTAPRLRGMAVHSTENGGLRLEIRTSPGKSIGHVHWEAIVSPVDQGPLGVKSIGTVKFTMLEFGTSVLWTDELPGGGHRVEGDMIMSEAEDFSISAEAPVVYGEHTGRFATMLNVIQKRGSATTVHLDGRLSRPLEGD